MSLTFAQIEALYNEIKALILGSQCLDFFEIGSRKLVLLLSKSDQIIKLLLCFQEP